ncbi:hypothetical protein WUBG_14777, partial [Wuchereria bancrofti]
GLCGERKEDSDISSDDGLFDIKHQQQQQHQQHQQQQQQQRQQRQQCSQMLLNQSMSTSMSSTIQETNSLATAYNNQLA